MRRASFPPIFELSRAFRRPARFKWIVWDMADTAFRNRPKPALHHIKMPARK